MSSRGPDSTPQTPCIKTGLIVSTDIQPQYVEPATLQSPNGTQPLWSDLTMEEIPGSASMLADFDEDFLKPWRGYLPTPDGLSPTFNLSNELVTYDSTAASNLNTHELLLGAPQSNHDDVRACDCFHSIVQALNKIEYQSKSTRTPSLEAVLSASKDMIARGEAVLRCPCSDDSTLVMLLTGLIAKHLTFHVCEGNGLDPLSSSSSSASKTSISLPASRVTVGNYTMDGDDEERLRIEIVMMELQKMGTLLMNFRSKFASLPVGYEGHTNETMLNFLNIRLREATDRLQREKQRLNES